MKTYLSLLSLLFILFVSTASAQCDTCRIEAKLTYQVNNDCSVTLRDSSRVPLNDTCSTYLYSKLNLGTGTSPFTFYSGNDTTHYYSQGNYTACLVAYARTIYWDTLNTRWDTLYCSDTACVSFYVPICETWGFGRIKTTDEVSTLSIYPNPASEQLNISPSVNAERIRILNIQGKVVFDQEGLLTPFTLNADEFGKGIYFVEETKNGKRTIEKLVIN